MKDLMEKKISRRTITVAFFFLLWFAFLSVRLVQLQVIDHSRLRSVVNKQNENKVAIFPQRGAIYDRTGIVLACSIPCRSIFYSPVEGEPSEVQYRRIQKLRNILSLSTGEMRAIKDRINKNKSFIWIRQKTTLAKAERVLAMNLKGIAAKDDNKRFYPQKNLASHILGRVDIDDKGQSGIEYRYDSLLAGKKGEGLNLRDARRRRYQFEILKNPEPGKDLVLTIDETIQYLTERELKQAIFQSKALGGTAIVSHPASGEILAMANYPDFDPNIRPAKVSSSERNRAIHHTFDPGSTFKLVTASAALESNTIDPEYLYDCTAGFRSFGRKTIRDHHKFGRLNFAQVIINSSNVGVTLIADQIGADFLNDMIRKFFFGQKTGIDLPAEEKGIFRPLHDWEKYSHNYLSVGYEINVTAIQLLQSYNIIANRGTHIPFRIVKNSPATPEEQATQQSVPRQVISETTAAALIDIFEQVILEGTGKNAWIKGYSAAGKTGTAQKIDPETRTYSNKSHVASFAGFIPAENPVISIIVIIDAPQGKYYGNDVAAPIFAKIGAQTLQYLRIPRENRLLQMTASTSPGRTELP